MTGTDPVPLPRVHGSVTPNVLQKGHARAQKSIECARGLQG